MQKAGDIDREECNAENATVFLRTTALVTSMANAEGCEHLAMLRQGHPLSSYSILCSTPLRFNASGSHPLCLNAHLTSSASSAAEPSRDERGTRFADCNSLCAQEWGGVGRDAIRCDAMKCNAAQRTCAHACSSSSSML